MARQTKRGICELCGAHTNVGMNHGSAACPACTHVQTALNKRPEAVAKAIRAMGKTEELLSALIPAGGGIAVKVTADLLQEISGIVGYDGEDPAELVEAVRGAIATKKATALDCGDCDLAGCFNELAELVDQRGASAGQVVEAVRRRVLTCASCDAEDVLHEIREIVGYTPEQGDKGLADAVRIAVIGACADCTSLKCDLLQACELDLDLGTAQGWSYVAAASIQTIANLEHRRDSLIAKLTQERAVSANLRNEIARLSGQTHSESEQVTALRDDLSRSTGVIEQLRAELTLVEQARDEWEQRCAAAEESMRDMEVDLCDRDNVPATNADTTYLLDIALRALRGEGPDAGQLAGLIEAARRSA